MSIRILRSLIAAALLSAGLAQAAVKVGDVEFAQQQTVQQRALELNGAGLRTRLGFKVYAMGLYLRAPLAEAGTILADKGEKRIRIVLIRDLEAKQFGDALQAGLARRCASAHSAPSKASSQRLTSSSQPSRALAKPPSPAAEVTRWQGTIRGKGLAPQAWPTARGALPRLVASSP